MEIDPLSLETLVYGVNPPGHGDTWVNHPFPFNGAKTLQQVTWTGTDIESLSQALPDCPNVTALNFTLRCCYGYEPAWTIERLQMWPGLTQLRQLDIEWVEISNDIGWSCFLHPFARFSRQVHSHFYSYDNHWTCSSGRGFTSCL